VARYPAKERSVFSKASSLTREPTQVTLSVDTVGSDLLRGKVAGACSWPLTFV